MSVRMFVSGIMSIDERGRCNAALFDSDIVTAVGILLYLLDERYISFTPGGPRVVAIFCDLE